MAAKTTWEIRVSLTVNCDDSVLAENVLIDAKSKAAAIESAIEHVQRRYPHRSAYISNVDWDVRER